jgi:putative ubiquitin-RnfH superfamily antitoxin RatB of RatAB toxin-antitoxin module
MANDAEMSIVLVYSPRPRAIVEELLMVQRGCTVEHALQASRFTEPGVSRDWEVAGYGVWGKKVGPAHVLSNNDRLEIYRALTVDPKVARRERFARQGAKKKAAGLFARRRAGAKAGY